MMISEVCAVVVTYHPDTEVLNNLRVLRHQVKQVVVVDNGSFESELTPLRAMALELNLQVLFNARNAGIATALNQGVQQASQLGASWVILFDQDSRVTPGFMKAMRRSFEGDSRPQTLAILNPRYRDSRSGKWIPSCRRVAGGLEQATTSGSLMPMSIFVAVGGFADELFIDGVDYDYSLRVRRSGYRIAECAEAELIHSPGTLTTHSLFGRLFAVSNYSPVRRYYQERNKILLAKRHGLRFPAFFANQFLISAKEVLKIVLAEQNKMSKVMAILNGYWHGLLGRSGEHRLT